MNFHQKVSLERIFESKSKQVSVAQSVAKGSIWQLDLKEHEMKIYHKVSLASTENAPSSALPSSGKAPSSGQNPASQQFLFSKSSQ